MDTRRTVTLNDAEQRIAKWIGAQRTHADRNCANYRMGPQSDADINFLGFAAELAFCKLFNVFPDFDIRPRRGTTDAERFGQTIDVKATRYPHGKLIVIPRKRELRADVYALLIEQWPMFTFIGFMAADEIFRDGRLTDLGHGATYAADQNELDADQIHW